MYNVNANDSKWSREQCTIELPVSTYMQDFLLSMINALITRISQVKTKVIWARCKISHCSRL